MKLIIQIPCFNEEQTLPATVMELPKKIPGIDIIEYLVIDDGSSDNTVAIAKQLGVQHVISLGTNRGLATAFRYGLQYAIEHGADIVVNTDADNQYYGGDIKKLVMPILDGKADMVIGCRPIIKHPEFHIIKKGLQLIGSWVLRQLSKTNVKDAASGFRSYSREACQRIFIHSQFSHCMESLIQAGSLVLRVESVDIRINAKTRKSRLFKNIPQYIYQSTSTLLSMFVLYRPGRFFFSLGSIFMLISLLIGLRFIYLMYWQGLMYTGHNYIPSLIFLSICSFTGLILYALSIIGNILKSQRRLIEENLYLLRKQLFDDK